VWSVQRVEWTLTVFLDQVVTIAQTKLVRQRNKNDTMS
jgi:hypothetical protein